MLIGCFTLCREPVKYVFMSIYVMKALYRYGQKLVSISNIFKSAHTVYIISERKIGSWFGQELAHVNNLCYYILGHRLIY